MSILPTKAQVSTSSSSFDSISPNPNSNHGNPLSPSQSPSSLSRHFQSMPFSHSQSPIHESGLLAPATEDSGGSSRKVSESRRNGRKSFQQQNGDINSQSHLSGQGGGSAQAKGKQTEAVASPRGQRSHNPTNSQGGITQSYRRRAHTMNANHLLNFHYDPIARSQPKAPPPRRQQKIKPYNKDLFLQANYKFVVLDTGDHAPEMMDPDKMLMWEDIICVRYATPLPVQCPICLEQPLCPQITSCGHIFCFPCILQYLIMGKEDDKGDCFKRCPLCFVMISQRELYTINIENVNTYSVGDTIDFMLLTRQKDSFIPSQKIVSQMDTGFHCNNDTYDPFSKFTFTSDVEHSVRKAISDLDSWLAKAQSGLVDDLEKLPYVCAAMEQLKQRKKYWNEQHVCNRVGDFKDKQAQELLLTENVNCAYHDGSSCTCLTHSVDVKDGHKRLDHMKLDVVESLEDQGSIFSTSYDESKSLPKISNGSRDVKESDPYNFYQAVDGQHLILHPLNMKCLLHHYGSYDKLPHRISGKILQLETVTQSEAIRRRYRYLSHFSLTTTFQLCEIDLSEVLPHDALLPFMDEIKKREKHRKQLAKKEHKEKIKAEAAAAADSLPGLSSLGHFSRDDSPKFSMDDFEALRSNNSKSSSPPTLSSPPVGDRILFSNVTRLGFAASLDSPALKIEETSAFNSNKVVNNTSGTSGTRNSGPPTFANVTSRVKPGENVDAPKTNEIGKRGKKPSRVLMSTAGGRRY